MHIRRKDPLVKLISYTVLVIYWFHPLVWLSFILMTVCVLAVLGIAGFLAMDQKNEKTDPFPHTQTVPDVSGTESQIPFDAYDTETMPSSKIPEGERAGLQDFLTQWAQTFCDRDSTAVLNFPSQQTISQLREQGLLDGKSFGMSSPWPMNPDYNIQIAESTENSAAILCNGLRSTCNRVERDAGL